MGEWGGPRSGSGRWSKAELEALARGDSDQAIAAIRGRSIQSIQRRRADPSPAPRARRKKKAEPATTALATIPAATVPAEPKKAEARPVSNNDLLLAIQRSKAQAHADSRAHGASVFRPAEFPPQATPPKGLQMAMDENLDWAGQQLGGTGAIIPNIVGGIAFMGYPFLAELTQRPEYRVISETIADDATRKWIDFEVTGDEDKNKNKNEDQNEDPAKTTLDHRLSTDEGREPPPPKPRDDPDERKKKLAKAGKTDKVKALKDELTRLGARDHFYNLMVQDGFYGRSHLFFDFGVDLDGAGDDELKTPIGDGRDAISKAKVERGSLKALQVVEAMWTYPIQYNAMNPLKQDWYRPEQWWVMGKQVHRSRIPDFIGHPLASILKPAYAFGGLSLSQMAKPYVDIWLKTRASVGELIHSFSVMVLLTDMQSMLQPAAGAPDLMTRVALFNAYRDNQGAFVLNKATEDFKNVSASLAGLHELQAQSQEHMCVQKGTFIETARGSVPVEQVTVDDLVLTRAGFAPIKWIGVTKLVDTLVEIEAGGALLRVTEDHPIWSTSINEFVSARSVSLSHRLLALGTTNRESTAHRSRGAAAGGGRLSAAITATKKLAAFSTTLCGKPIEALSHAVTKFTTRMMTALTTLGTTWSLLPEPNTWSATAALAAPSSASMQKSASHAAPTSRRPGRGRDIAPQIANHERTGFAAGSQCKPSNASAAAVSSCPSENERLDSAPALASSVPVTRVCAIKVPYQPVYDIEVDGLPEFFANGILVHNSSVSRIPLVKLTGISPSGLNASSEGEIRAYYDTIAAYQNRFFRPNLTKLINFVQLSLWGEIDPEITFEFEPLWELSQKEKSEKEKDDADRDQKYVDMGAFSPAEIRKIKIDDPTLPYTDLNPEDLPDLEQEEEQGLEPEGGRPQPIIGQGQGEGEPPPGGEAEDDDPAVAPGAPARPRGLPWADQYEWMRGYDLPATARNGATIVKAAPAGSIAAQKGLRIGSRVRFQRDGQTGFGRVFGFVPSADGVCGVGVLDIEGDRMLFLLDDSIATRPVAAQDHALEGRRGGDRTRRRPFDEYAEGFALDAGFNEGDHPRDETGQFAKAASALSKAVPELAHFKHSAPKPDRYVKGHFRAAQPYHQIMASTEVGSAGNPVTIPGHATGTGITINVNPKTKHIHFSELNSHIKGAGRQMVEAIIKNYPDYKFSVTDWSSGGKEGQTFWQKMEGKYPDKFSHDAAIDAEFKEGDHPRAPDGRFGSTAGEHEAPPPVAGKSPPARPEPEAASAPEKRAPVFKTKKDHAEHLLKKGVTTAEMLEALGWPSISMPAMAKSLNMRLDKTKEGRITKYVGIPLGPASRPAKTHSLLPFLASRGGIRNDDGNIGDLRHSIGAGNKFIPGFGQLIRKPDQISTAAQMGGKHRALKLDAAREAAIEGGYINEKTTLPEFLEIIDRELRGDHVYPEGYLPENRPDDPDELERAQDNFVSDLNDTLKESGGADLTDKERDRAIALWKHEGLNDPSEIIERLALEADDDEREHGGPARGEPVAGWDVPDDF